MISLSSSGRRSLASGDSRNAATSCGQCTTSYKLPIMAPLSAYHGVAAPALSCPAIMCMPLLSSYTGILSILKGLTSYFPSYLTPLHMLSTDTDTLLKSTDMHSLGHIPQARLIRPSWVLWTPHLQGRALRGNGVKVHKAVGLLRHVPQRSVEDGRHARRLDIAARASNTMSRSSVCDPLLALRSTFRTTKG